MLRRRAVLSSAAVAAPAKTTSTSVPSTTSVMNGNFVVVHQKRFFIRKLANKVIDRAVTTLQATTRPVITKDESLTAGMQFVPKVRATPESLQDRIRRVQGLHTSPPASSTTSQINSKNEGAEEERDGEYNNGDRGGVVGSSRNRTVVAHPMGTVFRPTVGQEEEDGPNLEERGMKTMFDTENVKNDNGKLSGEEQEEEQSAPSSSSSSLSEEEKEQERKAAEVLKKMAVTQDHVRLDPLEIRVSKDRMYMEIRWTQDVYNPPSTKPTTTTRTPETVTTATSSSSTGSSSPSASPASPLSPPNTDTASHDVAPSSSSSSSTTNDDNDHTRSSPADSATTTASPLDRQQQTVSSNKEQQQQKEQEELSPAEQQQVPELAKGCIIAGARRGSSAASQSQQTMTDGTGIRHPTRLLAEFLRAKSTSTDTLNTTVYMRRGVKIVDLYPIGNYAIRISFSDDHNGGIYPYTYLHYLGGGGENGVEIRGAKFGLMRDYIKELRKARKSREPLSNRHWSDKQKRQAEKKKAKSLNKTDGTTGPQCSTGCAH